MKHTTLLIFVLAVIIRLINLNQSLWLDEATSAMSTFLYDAKTLITQFSPRDFHPPFYYLFLDFWVQIFGNSEISLRLPSVFFSVLTGYILMKIFRGSDLLFLFNPLIVYFSQEARMYSMATFFVALSFYFFTKNVALKTTKITPYYWLFLTTSILAFYTFYATVFFVSTAFLYLLISRKFKLFFIGVFIFFCGVSLISPLLIIQLINSRQALDIVLNWSQVLGTATLKNLILIPIKFTSGRISFEPKIIYYLVSGLWLSFISLVAFHKLAFLRQLFVKIKSLSFNQLITDKYFLYIFFLSFPLIQGYFFSFFSPLLQFFRFQYLIIFLSLLLAYSISTIKKESIKKAVYMVTFSGYLFFSLLYLLIPNFHREDWKSLTLEIVKEDLPIYMIQSSSDPLKYYNKNLNSLPLQDLLFSEKIKDQFVVIPYTSEIHGVNYQSSLNALNFEKISEKSFRGLSYEIWKK